MAEEKAVDFSLGKKLLDEKLALVHAGIPEVAQGARAASVEVTQVEFLPPAGGDLQRLKQLQPLFSQPFASMIEKANRLALERFMQSAPHLIGVGLAREVIPHMREDLFLHAGPPIEWERMSGPLQGAIMGGVLLEGRAKSPSEARALAASGQIRFEPCHHHQAVGPMAGVVTPSMPVWIIEDQGGAKKGHRSFCTLNEGLGKVLRYGAFGEEVMQRLQFMAQVVAPVLSKTLQARGPIDLKTIMAQALQMGDEGHNRNRAGTSLLFRELAPFMVRAGGSSDQVAAVLEFIHKNDHFFLNLSMPMAKCMMMAAEGIAHSSMVTVMARNGTDFGIGLSCLPGQWFVGPAQQVSGLYFPGYSSKDANPDIGDSAITETSGLGAFSMAAAPAIVQFIGGSAEDAQAASRQMARITLGSNPSFAIPALGFLGAPTGIDIRKVEELNLLPTINTGIAHKDAGVGQVGAGLVNPPWACFHQALNAFYKHMQSQVEPSNRRP